MIDYFYQTILTGGLVSIIIAITAIVSPYMDKKYFATWRLGIWKTCIAFLILPVGILFKFLPPLKSIAVETLSVAIPITAPSSTTFSLQSMQEVIIPNYFNAINSLFALWMSVVCFLLVYHIWSYVRFNATLKTHSTLLSAHVQEKIFANYSRETLKIYENVFVLTPMIVGVLHPCIILPKRTYDDETISIIIEHEFTHYRRKDLWCKFFCLVAKIFYWYNPLIHVMHRRLEQDIELCCDFQVLKNKHKSYRHKYSDILVKEALNATEQRQIMLACMGSAKKPLKLRLHNIFAFQRKQSYLGIVLSITLLFFTSAYVFSDSVTFKTDEGAAFESQVKLLIQQKEELNRPNGDIGAYFNTDNEFWYLKQGETINFHLLADSRYYGNNSGLEFGYTDSSSQGYIALKNLSSENLLSEVISLSFTAPHEGSYYFYLLSTGDGVVIKNLKLISKQ